MLIYVGLFLLSAATLAFEINLTRLFSVAQFYHFAFMVVSLALLGFGASGTSLTLFPRLRQHGLRLLSWLASLFAFATVGSYVLTLYVPFDSFRVARDWRQLVVLLLHYVALAVPFFCSGTAVGLLLMTRPKEGGRVYAANLTGSAVGCALAVATPALVGGEGVVLLCAALGLVAAFFFQRHLTATPRPALRALLHLLRVAQAALILVLLVAALRTPDFLNVRLSPYKSLSYLLQYPDAERVFQGWNGFSRVDVVRSESIRGLPGSGFRCSADPPRQLGLTVDGDDLNYISQVEPGFTDLAFTDCLLTALPYRLRPGARALVLEPGGGLEVLTALAEGAGEVTVVEPNPLIVTAVRQQGEWAGDLYDDPRVNLVVEQGRTYARRTHDRYRVVTLSLNTPQRTVTSGAYSLNEDYRYTVEAFADYLVRLRHDGLLVVTRWLQVPPSESIRAFALAVEAVEHIGDDPRTSIVALRSYRQMLILVRRGRFTAEELDAVRAFADLRAFDLVYMPDIRLHEVNRYNVLPDPVYHQACVGLLDAQDRHAWYRGYSFDVKPTTDDHPFFGHFFRWAQTREVLAMAGHTWQPFGGAGYFVLLILLVLAVVAAGVLIVLPIAGLRRQGRALGRPLVYFALLGLGYLCVEIPLMQRFILFLGQPAYALAVVLFAILLFSGVGSAVSDRLPLRPVLILLPALVGTYVLLLSSLFEATLGAALWARVIIAVATLAPLGFLMGIPFPKGIALLEQSSPILIPWAWGVNGAISVVASVLAALLALSWGFSVVLLFGAASYAVAGFTVVGFTRPRFPGSPPR